MTKFYKYQGAGNDFIMIDNRLSIIKNIDSKLIKKLCSRRFGIGSDGLILIETHATLDFYMNFFNPDGSQSFCGNGSRCAVAFAKQIGAFEGVITKFEAIDGEHQAVITEDGIKVSMGDISEIKRIDTDYFIDTGSPHYISFCETNDSRDIVEYGKSIRYSEGFKPQGTNVNLISVESSSEISIRTYERGVEAETFACGTGATACAISFAEKQKIAEGEIDVNVRGGVLKVYFSQSNQKYESIYLEGPAKLVFQGEVSIN